MGSLKRIFLAAILGIGVGAFILVYLWKFHSKEKEHPLVPPSDSKPLSHTVPLVSNPITFQEERPSLDEAKPLKKSFSRQGTIKKEKVMRFLRSRTKGIQKCYERRLKIRRDLEGKIYVLITIGPRGKVLEASIDRDLVGDAQLKDCILRLIRSWRFPSPKGGEVTILYPFRFFPRE
jgi:TonB family protein